MEILILKVNAPGDDKLNILNEIWITTFEYVEIPNEFVENAEHVVYVINLVNWNIFDIPMLKWEKIADILEFTFKIHFYFNLSNFKCAML